MSELIHPSIHHPFQILSQHLPVHLFKTLKISGKINLDLDELEKCEPFCEIDIYLHTWDGVSVHIIDQIYITQGTCLNPSGKIWTMMVKADDHDL